MDGVKGENKTRGLKLQVSDVFLIIFYIVLILPWTVVFVVNYEPANMVANFLDNGMIAKACYRLPYTLVLTMTVMGIVWIIQHRYYITWGAAIMAVSGVAAVGQSIFNEQAFELDSVIGIQVFNVYGEIWIVSLALSAILTLCIYIKNIWSEYRNR